MRIQEVLARRIREERKKLGLTQAELAAKVGVTGQSLYRWEAGMQLPRAEDIDRLGEILGIESAELFSRPRPPTPTEALEVLRLALNQTQSPLSLRAARALDSMPLEDAQGFVELIEASALALRTDESSGTQEDR